MEINPKVPVNLLRAGRIFVFEPAAGVKANLLRTFSILPATRMNKVSLDWHIVTCIQLSPDYCNR